MKKQLATLLAVTALGIGVLSGCGVSAASNSTGSSSDSAGAIEITNVSYDPTRELYAAYNDLFAKHWKEEKGQDVSVVQSHGGSGKQALEVANGLQADVLLAWENEAFLSLDEHPGEYEIVVPSVSILCQPTVSVVDEVVDKRGTRDVATEYLNYLYSDEAQKLEADVLLAWENEAFLSLDEHPGEYEIVVPSVSILCQPTVSVVDEVVDKRGTRDVATEYLNYLYSDEAQKLEAEWYYRPSDQDILKQFEYQGQSNTISELPQDGKWIITNVDLTDISHFGGWTEASKKHFADGGLFDSIYEEKN